MRGTERVLAALHRRWYMFAVYTGIRGIVNRALSVFRRRDTGLAALHGSVSNFAGFGRMILSVHFRGRPQSGSKSVSYGLFSLRLEYPRMPRLLYRYFCQTSHFGLGHMEVAFYKEGRTVTFHGVRNIARSNASRLGLDGLEKRFQLKEGDEDLLVVSALARVLQAHGFETRFAGAEECVRLSVSKGLLHPSTGKQAMVALNKKYKRLRRKLRRC